MPCLYPIYRSYFLKLHFSPDGRQLVGKKAEEKDNHGADQEKNGIVTNVWIDENVHNKRREANQQKQAARR